VISKMQEEVEKTLEIGSRMAEGVKAYVDNIIVATFEGGVEAHVERLVKTIRKLTKDGFRLRPEKCKFGFKKLRLMGAFNFTP